MEIRQLREIDRPGVLKLMAGFSLEAPEHAEFGVGAFEGAHLLGCCQFKDGLIQGLAVSTAHQGEGLAAQLVGELIRIASSRGVHQLSVITKPEASAQFSAIGFRLVASAPPYASFLEFGSGGTRVFAKGLTSQAVGKSTPRATIVMNANPFTLGHRHLIECASKENGWVFVLAVEEDISEFPFKDRLMLLERGVSDLTNVSVLKGGPYVVSRLTFPSYFTKQAKLAAAQGSMDAALFCAVIAPALGVTRRYVGTEPFSPVTAEYNEALKARLPREGIKLIELVRLEREGVSVSASEVRARLKEGDMDAACALVPDTTKAYLRSPDAAEVLARLKGERL